MSRGRDTEVVVLTRMEIREKLIEALDLPPQTFSGMTLEEIVKMVGEANRSLRQRIDDLQEEASYLEQRLSEATGEGV